VRLPGFFLVACIAMLRAVLMRVMIGMLIHWLAFS
jgi:hypothetical protein